MVAFRSRRIESLLSASLDDLTAAHVHSLVANSVEEQFDLDYKAMLYGGKDEDKRALAGDVAAMANTAGVIIILGIEEDAQSRATAAPLVEVSDMEVRRIQQIVASLVAPIPVFDVLMVNDTNAPPSPASLTRGFIVIAVARSNSARHAVLVNQALRYPRRNGPATCYLSESEVATAYRDRFAGFGTQLQRSCDIEEEAIARLDRSDDPWLIVGLVPDLPGDFPISQGAFRDFQSRILGTQVGIVNLSISWQRARVGTRRLLADGSSGGSRVAERATAELHTDGAGVYGLVLVDLNYGDRQNPINADLDLPRLVDDEWMTIALLSGLNRLAEYARDRVGAGGNAVVVRARLISADQQAETEIGYRRQIVKASWPSSFRLNPPLPIAERVASLDDLVQPGPPLVSVAAELLNEIGQAFGIPELPQLTTEGELRRSYWSRDWFPQMQSWAQQHGISVAEDTLS